VNVFRAPEGFLIALTYGRESEWVRNVVAAGACQLETRGVQYQLSAATIVHDPTRRRFPIPVQIVLRLIWCERFHAAFNFSIILLGSRLAHCRAWSSVQGTTNSQNRLEPSTSVMRGVTSRLAVSFSKLALPPVVARKPSLQTIIPLPVAW
jgi:hypothetical protein